MMLSDNQRLAAEVAIELTKLHADRSMSQADIQDTWNRFYESTFDTLRGVIPEPSGAVTITYRGDFQPPLGSYEEKRRTSTVKIGEEDGE